jgi:hypothetical protein
MSMMPGLRLSNAASTLSTRSARLIAAAALLAVGAGATTVPVGAATRGTTAAGHHAHLTLTGPRADALNALRHLARPTTRAGLIARYAAEARARATLARGAQASTDLAGSLVSTPTGQMALEAPVADGSSGDDVLVLTLPDTRPSTLSLRSGRTGATRWTVKLADAFGIDVARLGPARKLAAVVYQTAFTGTGSADPTGLEDTGGQDNSVVVVDLASGKTDWTSTVIHGTYAVNDSGFTEGAALYPAGILHDRGGDRLLGALVTQSYGPGGSAVQQQPVAFDGVTGAMTPLGQPTVSDAFAFLEPAGDLNGDGLTDVIQVLSGDASAVVVDSGAPGPALWVKPTLPSYFVDAVPVPDLDGDHYNDVLISDDGGPTAETGTVTAYAGAAGASLWTRSGYYGFPVGVIGGRGAVAVVDGFDQISVQAVAGKGTTLWHHTITVPLGDGGGAGIELGDCGDVDADHVSDVLVDVEYSGSLGAGHFASIVSARTGAIHTGPSVGSPLFGSLDGHGDDFLQVTRGTNTLTLAGYDGNSRHRLWRMTLPNNGMRPFVFGADAVPLAGRGRGLVLDVWDGAHTVLLAIGGRSGHRFWKQTI